MTRQEFDQLKVGDDIYVYMQPEDACFSEYYNGQAKYILCLITQLDKTVLTALKVTFTDKLTGKTCSHTTNDRRRDGTLVLKTASNSSNPNTMTNVLTFFRNLTLTKGEKLMLKFGLEDPTGVPTRAGLDLMLEAMWATYRPEAIKLAEQMETAEKEDKK